MRKKRLVNDFKNHKRVLSMKRMMIAADNDSDFPTAHKVSFY